MRFEKVSYENFAKDSGKNGFTSCEEAYESIVIPYRGSAGSAGYDFSTPYPIHLDPDERIIVPTGIKAYMESGEVLLITVRSSVGIKDGVVFSNTLAVIDRDYADNEKNEGDIMLALWNTSNKPVKYHAGDRIAQGMFVKFGITDDDNATGVRVGGIGSSGK